VFVLAQREFWVWFLLLVALVRGVQSVQQVWPQQWCSCVLLEVMLVGPAVVVGLGI
jgi:hypothetical protein